ncbi:MAG: 50S ribosomal protein L35 [Candidatus Omnitrophota bacterium]
MPKLKTRKGVAKRFRFSKKGKLKHARGGKSHLGTNKERERMRKLRRAGIIGKRGQSIKYLKRLLPYG